MPNLLAASKPTFLDPHAHISCNQRNEAPPCLSGPRSTFSRMFSRPVQPHRKRPRRRGLEVTGSTTSEVFLPYFSCLERRIWCEVAIQRNSGHEECGPGPDPHNPLNYRRNFHRTSMAHQKRRPFRRKRCTGSECLAIAADVISVGDRVPKHEIPGELLQPRLRISDSAPTMRSLTRPDHAPPESSPTDSLGAPSKRGISSVPMPITAAA